MSDVIPVPALSAGTQTESTLPHTETERFAAALNEGAKILIHIFGEHGFNAEALADRKGWEDKFRRRLDVLMRDLFPIYGGHHPLQISESLMTRLQVSSKLRKTKKTSSKATPLTS